MCLCSDKPWLFVFISLSLHFGEHILPCDLTSLRYPEIIFISTLLVIKKNDDFQTSYMWIQQLVISTFELQFHQKENTRLVEVFPFYLFLFQCL